MAKPSEVVVSALAADAHLVRRLGLLADLREHRRAPAEGLHRHGQVEDERAAEHDHGHAVARHTCLPWPDPWERMARSVVPDTDEPCHDRDMAPDTIVLVHGFWVTPRSWENWVTLLRVEGIPGHRARLPGLRGRGGGAAREPADHRRRHRAGHHRQDRGGDPRARQAADHHGSLRRRRLHPGPARPRLRRRGRRAELGADRGRPGRAAVAGEVDLPGAQEPGEPAQGGRAHRRAVAYAFTNTFSEEESLRAVRALPHPRQRRDPLGQRAGQLPARSAGDLGRLPQRRPRAAAVRLRQRGPHHAAGDPAVQHEALQVRTPSPRSASTRATRTCCPPRRAGRRSPTTSSTGPSSTRDEPP